MKTTRVCPVDQAETAGLTPVQQPKVLLSKAVLLEKA